MKHHFREKRMAVMVRYKRYKAHIWKGIRKRFYYDVTPLVQSLLIHASLIALLVIIRANHANGNPGGDSKTPSSHVGMKDENSDKTIIDKPTEVQIVEVPKDGLNHQKPVYADRACSGNNWYGGVGVISGYDYTKNVVVAVSVHAGYPADKMGLLAGDIILNEGSLTGAPGTPVTIEVVRNGERLTLTGVREKICIEG